jgi:hypothetical protein
MTNEKFIEDNAKDGEHELATIAYIVVSEDYPLEGNPEVSKTLPGLFWEMNTSGWHRIRKGDEKGQWHSYDSIACLRVGDRVFIGLTRADTILAWLLRKRRM